MTFRLPNLRLTTRAVTVLAVLAAVAMFALAPGGGSVANAQEGVPDKPKDLTGKLLQFGSAELDWNDVQGAETYEAQYWDNTDASNNPWADPPSVEYDGSSAVLSGLPNQNVFYFQVRARNSAGTSEWSDYILVRNPEGGGWLPTIVNICDRTEQVRDAILAKLRDVSDCAAVTDSDLNRFRSLYLNDEEITALQAGDFQGLANLERLYLDGNSLTELPDGVFDGLANLERLKLNGNSLTELPDGVFDGLSNLVRLSLYGNSLTALPDGVFDSLSNLVRLRLYGNSLTALPAGVFDSLSNLQWLYLSNNDLTALPAGVFDSLSNLETLSLHNNDLTILPDSVFDGLSNLEWLYLHSNDLTTLPDGVFESLANLESLWLNDNDLTALPADVFDGLTNLKELSLDNNDLTALPADVFDGLTNLEKLWLRNNDLTALPSGVFDGLTNLKELPLISNDLNALPDGVFEGLSSLEYVNLVYNPGVPFVLTAELEQQGDDAVVVKVAEGAPVDMSITLSGRGGTLSSTTVTIAGGSLASEPVTVTPSGQGYVTVTVELALFEIPSSRYAFSGLQTGLGAPLVMGSAPPPESNTGICDRTPQVVAAIMAKLPDVAGCSAVTAKDLAGIIGILQLERKGITRLKSGDFRGLSSLELLRLNDNELSALPADVFDGLSYLKHLWLDRNDLTTLPDGVFDSLTNLRGLSWDSNGLTTLPDGVLDGLSNLGHLSWDSNGLTTLPDGAFNGLSNLKELDLSNNDLSTLPDGVFDGLSKLDWLDLSNNDLTTLPDGVFDGLSNLKWLYLYENALTALPDGVFGGLSNLAHLRLAGNGLTKLPDGVFGGLSNLAHLDLAGNALNALPDGVFNGLTKLIVLSLNSNGLTTLPDGVFDGLAKLDRLRLDNNGLTALPDGAFNGLSDLERLDLSNNDLTTLPDGVFDGLSDLERLWLYHNDLTALPDGVFDGLSRLTSMALDFNPGAPFTLTAELEQQGGDAVVVKVAEGTPVDMSITLSAQGGTLSSTTVTIEGGSLKSEAVTVTPSGQGQVTVTVESASFEIPSSYHYTGVQTGLGAPLVMGSTLPPASSTPESEPNELGPTVAVSLSPPTALVGTAIDVTMTFAGLELDSNSNTRDYIFRADVKNSANEDADACEDQSGGVGLGVERYMWQVDEDPETRSGTISANCPVGAYTIRASISTPNEVELAQATAHFTVVEPGPPPSSDATLSSLTLSDISYVLFGYATFDYTASVANGVDETTVTPTTNDDGATYAIKLGGVTHADGVIPLAVGRNVITVEVTAEDGNTARTYTITVTRAALSSTDATLSGLALSGVDFGTFDSATTGYTANVANDVTQTTVTPATNDNGATYAIELGGVADADGTVSLAVGSNVITIEVTAEDGNTAKTYTVTVTRATPTVSGPAVSIELSPSGSVAEGTEITVTMSFANLESDSDTSTTDYTFRVDVVNADACEGGGMGKDRYMYKVDEDPEVRTGSISTSCAPGDYTVEVSISSPGNAELASATAGFTVNAPAQQQEQPEPPSTDATLSGLTLSDVTLAFASATTRYSVSVANDVTETTVTPTTNDDGATHAIKLGGVTDADGVIPLAVGRNVITVEVTAEDGNTAKTYTVTVTRAEAPAPPTLSGDATLRSLTLSDAPFAFASDTTSYDVSVANGVDQSTVTATANDGGASYAVKLGGVADEDGTVELSVGANAVSVVVTAEDGETSKTYTVTVTRADPPPPEPVEPEEESTGKRSAWLEENPENQPFVGEWQHFTLRGSGLDKVHLSVNVIGFGGAPSSTGAVGYATASPLPAVGEVCGDAYYSGYQMSVDATFSLVGCREGTVIIELLDPGNDWALLKRYTVTVNAGP